MSEIIPGATRLRRDDHIADLLDHLQEAVMRGEPHNALALKVQNIRAEHAARRTSASSDSD